MGWDLAELGKHTEPTGQSRGSEWDVEPRVVRRQGLKPLGWATMIHQS